MSNMKEQSAGGVIVKDGKVVIVTQRKRKGLFSLPKGHINSDENPLEAAYREIYEETGLIKDDLRFVKKLGMYNRPSGKEGNTKDFHFFLFKTDKDELKPIDKDNPEAMWIEIAKVAEFLRRKEDKEFFLNFVDEYNL